MKTKILKLPTNYLLLLPLCMILLGAGCEKEDAQLEEQLWEISPDGKNAVIQKEVNGIEFKYCLLNEAGEPATVFNQGENFTFSFSVKNNFEDTLTITTEFISSEFFRVYHTINNIDMGKPWTGLWCQFSGAPHTLKLPQDQSIQLNCPWVLTDNNNPDYPLCMSESKNPLAKGEYYTKLNLDFHYSKKGKNERIDNVIFKINFKIQ